MYFLECFGYLYGAKCAIEARSDTQYDCQVHWDHIFFSLINPLAMIEAFAVVSRMLETWHSRAQSAWCCFVLFFLCGSAASMSETRRTHLFGCGNFYRRKLRFWRPSKSRKNIWQPVSWPRSPALKQANMECVFFGKVWRTRTERKLNMYIISLNNLNGKQSSTSPASRM